MCHLNMFFLPLFQHNWIRTSILYVTSVRLNTMNPNIPDLSVNCVVLKGFYFNAYGVVLRIINK